MPWFSDPASVDRRKGLEPDVSESFESSVSLQLGLSPQNAKPAKTAETEEKDEDLRPQFESLAGKGAPEQGRKPFKVEIRHAV